LCLRSGNEPGKFSLKDDFFPPQIVAGPLSLVAETPKVFRGSVAAELARRGLRPRTSSNILAIPKQKLRDALTAQAALAKIVIRSNLPDSFRGICYQRNSQATCRKTEFTQEQE